MSFGMNQTMEQTVQMIQAGDQDLRERFIESNLTLLRKISRRFVRSQRLDSQDAFSISLMMFNRAIDRYDPASGVPFKGFAQLVIRNRLIDWAGKCQRQSRTLDFTDCETGEGIPFEERLADPMSSVAVENLETEESLAVLEGTLKTFGLTLDGMVDRFPIQKPSRLFCIKAGRQMAGDDQMMQAVMKTKRIPVSELSRRLDVPVKTIDRNRANIIFVALLLKSDLNLIQYYISAFEKEADHE